MCPARERFLIGAIRDMKICVLEIVVFKLHQFVISL
jgi:hypothetical protein